jgi:hypothetical protein
LSSEHDVSVGAQADISKSAHAKPSLMRTD